MVPCRSLCRYNNLTLSWNLENTRIVWYYSRTETDQILDARPGMLCQFPYETSLAQATVQCSVSTNTYHHKRINNSLWQDGRFCAHWVQRYRDFPLLGLEVRNHVARPAACFEVLTRLTAAEMFLVRCCRHFHRTPTKIESCSEGMKIFINLKHVSKRHRVVTMRCGTPTEEPEMLPPLRL